MSDSLSYIGILPLCLGLWAAFRSRGAKSTFFGLVALFSILVAFGRFTPLYKILYDVLPGLDLFRIPARFNCLLTFALAILSGYGCNLLLADSTQEEMTGPIHVTKVCFYFCLGSGLLLVLAWFILLSYQGEVPPISSDFVGSYILFLFVLGGTYSILLVRKKGISETVLKGTIIAMVSLDLLLVSLNFGPNPGGNMSSTDPAIIPERAKAIVGELKKDHELIRIGNSEGVLPHLLRYQENITTYDVNSMPNYVSLQFPSEYLQLYFLSDYNPELLDLLNVKYQVGENEPRISSFPPAIKLGGTSLLKKNLN